MTEHDDPGLGRPELPDVRSFEPADPDDAAPPDVLARIQEAMTLPDERLTDERWQEMLDHAVSDPGTGDLYHLTEPAGDAGEDPFDPSQETDFWDSSGLGDPDESWPFVDDPWTASDESDFDDPDTGHVT